MTRPDPDTLQDGTNPPFDWWESDHTALVHVLRSARHQGLSLKDNADKIAEMILRSRWLAARQYKAATEAHRDHLAHETKKLRACLTAVEALIDKHPLGDSALIPATELRAVLNADPLTHHEGDPTHEDTSTTADQAVLSYLADRVEETIEDDFNEDGVWTDEYFDTMEA